MADQLKGILVLTIMYILGEFVSTFLHVSLPGSVIGLVLCLVAMILAPPLQAVVRPGALVMLALVPLFLVPLLVRMALTLDFASAETWAAIAVTTICALLGVAAAGLCVRLCLPEREVL